MQKNMAFYLRIGCVRFARHCGKMYSLHLFPYGGLDIDLHQCTGKMGCVYWGGCCE